LLLLRETNQITLLILVPLASKQDAEKDGIHYGYNKEVLVEYKNEDNSRRVKVVRTKPAES
jgi:hypothetical protein